MKINHFKIPNANKNFNNKKRAFRSIKNNKFVFKKITQTLCFLYSSFNRPKTVQKNAKKRPRHREED